MARTRKSIQPLNLYKYDVLIEDKATRSDYFKVTQFDGNFYGGRNAFLLAGTGVLRPNSKILVEILNKDGTTVYSAPITSFIEGNSRLVQIEVYSDTPIGPGKIVLLGCADTYLDGTPVPANWEGKYNVRWIADVVISPLIENKTPIRFEATPSIVATEKFYYTPSSSQFVEQIKVPVDIELTQKYYNVFPNGYLAKISGPNSTTYNSDYLGGAITGAIALSNGTVSTTSSINIPITKIYNGTLGESQGTLIYINNTLLSNAFLSSSGIYTTEIEPFGPVTVSSSINIQYNKLTTINTGSAVSFANLRLVDLKTISGEIHRIRLSYKSATEPGEFVSLGDINTTVAELLAVDSSSRIAQTGQFTDIKIDDYWYSETMSLQKNEVNPILPAYYISSSLSSSYLPIVQSSVTALDSITATPQIVNGRYINDASYFIGTKNTNTIQVFPRVEYTLAFDATVSNTSASVALTQTDYSLEVYLVAEAGYSTKLLDTNPRGQLLGILTPTSTFQRQNFEGTEFNFIPKIIATGNFGLRFIAYGGFWNIANVSVKAAQEPFFSPDEINILIPNANYTDSILTFRTQYLDVNNNSIGINTFSTPTYFTGSGTTLNSGTSISASYAATSSIATSASYAATASNVSGGLANYIPLWASATLLSSSNIYQSSGNIGIGTATPTQPLDVNGSLMVRGSIFSSGSMQLGTGATTGDVNIDVGSGRVGNGYAYIDLIGDGTYTDFGTRLIRFNSGPNASSYLQHRGTGSLFLYTLEAAPIDFYTTSTARMQIGSDGNVGINKTTPNSTLDVNGLLTTSGSTGISHGIRMARTGWTSTFRLGAVSASGDDFWITNNWNPSTNAADDASPGYITLAPKNELRTVIGGTRMVTVTNSGVGIGTTSPSGPLHVVGNATITGSLILSSSAPTELQVIGNTELTGSLSITGSTYIRPIIEHVVGTSSAPPATLNYNVLDGAILFHSGSATANWTLNFRGNASTTLNSIMPVSSSMTVTLLTRTTTAYSSSAYQIDGSSITPRWQGGASGSGNANSIDAHTFTIIKISSTPTYLLLGSITKYT
jgi:hypothetical protein